jgi:GNAT superfamily N-acetyltransferase
MADHPRAKSLHIDPVTRDEVPLLLQLIRELAEFEQLLPAVVATEENLRAALFSARPDCEAVLARRDGELLGFALFFHHFSTFAGRRGLYLEDLYVRPVARGHGVGKALLAYLAGVAVARRCARFEWSVAPWVLSRWMNGRCFVSVAQH